MELDREYVAAAPDERWEDWYSARLADRGWVAFPPGAEPPPCCKPLPVEADGGPGGTP